MYHPPEDNPCWQCVERQFGCHSGCEKHRQYKEMLAEEKEAELRGRKKDYPDKPIRPRRREKTWSLRRKRK